MNFVEALYFGQSRESGGGRGGGGGGESAHKPPSAIMASPVNMMSPAQDVVNRAKAGACNTYKTRKSHSVSHLMTGGGKGRTKSQTGKGVRHKSNKGKLVKRSLKSKAPKKSQGKKNVSTKKVAKSQKRKSVMQPKSASGKKRKSSGKRK